ncbi:hypothetical protein GN958_ATG17328 [Phytophthora infestans]|uniref:Uncharacterized protein n=1 Tax=Phytophthora infestans TaxID=4787 RepID=A0A8S9TXS2_PHYIN|nr:hypothetical protein GN958_ATG17328 [Phytophthora infestans]
MCSSQILRKLVVPPSRRFPWSPQYSTMQSEYRLQWGDQQWKLEGHNVALRFMSMSSQSMLA